MKKESILARLYQLKCSVEAEGLKDLVDLEIINLLLDYINDKQIREAVDDIPF